MSEHTHVSHVDQSVRTAKDILGLALPDGWRVRLDEETQTMVLRLIQSHSISSSRASAERVGMEWLLTLKVVQYADIFSRARAVGYLRGFSYSGHALKSLHEDVSSCQYLTLFERIDKFSEVSRHRSEQRSLAGWIAVHATLLSRSCRGSRGCAGSRWRRPGF